MLDKQKSIMPLFKKPEIVFIYSPQPIEMT